jgi:4-carboxymuconolactone decarboxylase
MKHAAQSAAKTLAVSLTWLLLAPIAVADQTEEAPAENVGREDEQLSRAQQLMGDIAPQLADLTDDVLYGQVWSRPGLSQRDRSLATVSALIAMDRPAQLRSHIRLARQNGVTEQEISEVITHMAFYSGWPTAVNAVAVAREVFEESPVDAAGPKSAEAIIVSRRADQSSVQAPAEYFTGNVRVEGRFSGTGASRVGGGTVVFSPASRTNWHRHPLGQTLIVTEGEGRVQSWRGPIQDIYPGDTVWIPAGVKHWHGAGPQSSMTHIAVAEAENGNSVEWLEAVTDAQYRD